MTAPTIFTIDPLRDPRWAELADHHPRASVFHTPGWLEALRRTYGYRPIVFSTSASNQDLRNGLLFCEVESFLTGRRLVSLPFADHCEPLVDDPEDFAAILTFLPQEVRRRKLKYIEIRPLGPQWAPQDTFSRGVAFHHHALDLRPEVGQLLRSFHKDSVQRRIRRAEREAMTYEEGRTDVLLDKFYGLWLLTRRRHGLPPQPRDWFRNLMTCLGERFTIRVASKDGQPVASIMTLRHGHTLVYKYGGSNRKFHNLGGTALLFWRAIQDGKREGLRELDLGRSDLDNPGLVAFKDHWGTTSSTLTYFRYPPASRLAIGRRYALPLARCVLACTPDRILMVAGELLYKHIG